MDYFVGTLWLGAADRFGVIRAVCDLPPKSGLALGAKMV